MDSALSTTVSETSIAKKTGLIMKEVDLQTPTALITTAGVDVWHKCLDHPSEYAMQPVKYIEEAGDNIPNSFQHATPAKMSKSTQRNHPKTTRSGGITERLQVVSTVENI